MLAKFHSSSVREKVRESKDVGKEKVSKSKVKLYEYRYCDKNTSKNIKLILYNNKNDILGQIKEEDIEI